MSTTVRKNVSTQLIEDEFVEVDKKKECLQTAIYDVCKRSPFMGSVLQCLDIFYTHIVPRAGIMFDANGKKWNMAINPYWFCMKLSYVEREAILLHEIYHVTHKHPMRAPFLKINQFRRQLMNIAMDMSINQYIQNLPKGCKDCPPLEEQFKGAECQNKLCPGGVILVDDYNDLDKSGNKVAWPKEKGFETYYHKLIERFEEADRGDPPLMLNVEFVFVDPLDVLSNGSKKSKILTSTNNQDLLTFRKELALKHKVALVAQKDLKENGVYDIVDLGSATTPFILQRHIEHCGSLDNLVRVGDVAVDIHQKVSAARPPKGWYVVGEQRAADSKIVNVDVAPLIFEEHDLTGDDGGGGGGMPNEFDSHQWDGSGEETEMMDATEDLVKRAMQKRGLSMDKLPGHVQELLQDIAARRTELNYRQLILSAIKRHASGFNREHSWTRLSRRFGNKAPGTRHGNLPKLDAQIDTSGSISVQEANDFLDIIDEFLKVGSRKCTLGLWHTSLYYHEEYKLGDRAHNAEWNKKFQSGGTDVGAALKCIYEKQPDLGIILTDGCYGDVDVESWLKPGETFPQLIWIISREGHEQHPLVRLGETIKIPNTDVMGRDKRLEQQ